MFNKNGVYLSEVENGTRIRFVQVEKGEISHAMEWDKGYAGKRALKSLSYHLDLPYSVLRGILQERALRGYPQEMFLSLWATKVKPYSWRRQDPNRVWIEA